MAYKIWERLSAAVEFEFCLIVKEHFFSCFFYKVQILVFIKSVKIVLHDICFIVGHLGTKRENWLFHLFVKKNSFDIWVTHFTFCFKEFMKIYFIIIIITIIILSFSNFFKFCCCTLYIFILLYILIFPNTGNKIKWFETYVDKSIYIYIIYTE